MTIFYILALVSLVIGMGAIFTLVEKFPVKLLYYHYHYRKPLIWSLFLGSSLYQIISSEGFDINSIPPLAIMGLAVILTYKVHQSNWFKAVYYPEMTEDFDLLPLSDDQEIALIEYEGVTKAYPLNYVIHHHIVNDKFNDKIIALTYCAMCRSIIPFNVTEIGPLFVASFKNANMIVADKKTGTFFQQATFDSIIGKLHPRSLEMITFQILPWAMIKELKSKPQVALINENDLRPFNLPMPGVWKKVMTSELTPGLSKKDTTFPSKTHVVGITDTSIKEKVFYLKSEVLEQKIVKNEKNNFTLISIGSTVTGFKTKRINIILKEDRLIEDTLTKSTWDITGKYLDGDMKDDLEKISISDEYWFSWKKFHPKSKLLRLSEN
ncbi:MAG: hypothetical protein COA49_08735 [Bacteroidetes bacterium]|nr:MAG: hypothetical protein COA49_08735 [Bacteroidota bacterium]